MKPKLIVPIFLLFHISVIATAQENKNEALYKYALKLEQEGKNADALTIFKNLLKADSANVDYLWRTSYLYSKVGHDQSTEEVRQQWYRTAFYLSEKALNINRENANAHYACAVALGRMNENAPSRTKIENARRIKDEAEAAIRLNPKLPGPYHVLGRWHRVVAGFSGFERTMIKTIFGGMPGGSYDDAIRNFEKAVMLEPLNILHQYELANSYYERKKEGDKTQAKNWLNKALLIPAKTKDDQENQELCRKLLAKISK
jgi:tetratricopeptide (TPR) repeat protein